MGLTHPVGTTLRNKYTIETALLMNAVDIQEKWYVLYCRRLDLSKPLDKQLVGLQELCRSKTVNEINKIKEMYNAVCPKEERFEASSYERQAVKRAEAERINISNAEMLKLCEILFKQLGVNADDFHKAVTLAVTPPPILKAKAIDTSLDAPQNPAGSPEKAVGYRVVNGTVIDSSKK